MATKQITGRQIPPFPPEAALEYPSLSLPITIQTQLLFFIEREKKDGRHQTGQGDAKNDDDCRRSVKW